MTDDSETPTHEPAVYADPNMVDPMWAIETARDAGMEVEDFLDEYNLVLPTEDESG